MNRKIAHIALVVKDYDEAIDFYTRKLHFKLVEDTPLGNDKRWVLVAPEKAGACCLLLAKAANGTQMNAAGNQSGGRVFLFLYTDDFERDYHNLKTHGIKIVRAPIEAAYGKVLVFEDLYGNLWDLIEPSSR